MIKENKFGIIVGFIFGLFSIFLLTLGLISNTAEIIGSIFRFPGPMIGQLFTIQTGQNSYSTSLAMPISFILNAIFYALIGMLLQLWFKKKKYVLFIFLGIIALFIITLLADAFFGNGLSP